MTYQQRPARPGPAMSAAVPPETGFRIAEGVSPSDSCGPEDATGHTASCDACGWVSKSTRSQAQAAHALRLHSCDRWLAKAAAARRARVRAAAVDREPKICRHPSGHQHGSYAMYKLDRCRCAECSAANHAYASNRQRQQAYGRWEPYVDANPVRRHVQHLQSRGLGLAQIAHLTGDQVSLSVLEHLVRRKGQRGRTQRIRKENADAVLAVQRDLTTLSQGSRVPSLGASRRLQALMTLGYSQSRLARELGIEPRNFGYVLHGGRQITVARHWAVVEVYRRLSGTQPVPSSRQDRSAITAARTYAAKHGFAAPIAWDDDELDLPEASPYVGPEEQRHRQLRPRSVVVEEVEFMLQMSPGTTLCALASRLEYQTRDGLQKALTRAGRTDLVDQLTRNETRAAA